MAHHGQQAPASRRAGRIRMLAGAAALAVLAGGAGAQETAPRFGADFAPDSGLSIGSFGLTGMIDMPVAVPQPGGSIAFNLTALPGSSRATLTFQITPRITGSFRYARLVRGAPQNDTLYDRSFDIRFLLLSEGPNRPAVALGLRDFIGTGEYSSEYLVATKQITPQLRLTGGIGWGRMASHGGFRNPLGALDRRFETRPGGGISTGGRVELSRFFRGDAALFGGVEFQATDRLRLIAEYSSDAYRAETAPGTSWRQRTPLNLGFRYAISQRVTLSGALMHGSVAALGMTFALHPDRPVNPLRVEAPTPVTVRPPPATHPQLWTEAWVDAPAAREMIRTGVAEGFAREGLRLEGIEVTSRRAVVRYANLRHRPAGMALGRAARVLSGTLPASVEEIVLVSTLQGIPGSAVTVRRSDLEALEYAPDGGEQLYARARIEDGLAAGNPGLIVPLAEDRPRFGWAILPHFQPAIMDPSAPIRLDVGVAATARLALASNLAVTGTLTQKIFGNVGDLPLGPPSCSATRCYEPVRTLAPLYASDRPVLQRLTIDHYARPGPNLYSRLSAGWLERMYGGVSAEVMWKPVDSRLAIGAEINRVRRRAPGSFAGFTGYEVTTGHVSVHYDFGNGFVGGVDVGQYLAGDRGATIRLEREFESGWRLGAYATLTDMPFSAFGEGSFDKGISITIPLSFFDGRPSRQQYSQTIRSLTRDGGARLVAANRLYPMVREMHRTSAPQRWEAVWQ